MQPPDARQDQVRGAVGVHDASAHRVSDPVPVGERGAAGQGDEYRRVDQRRR